MEKLYVIKIVKTINADSSKWYEGKDTELYVCRVDKEREGYRTFNRFRNDEGEMVYGHIPNEFAEIVLEFEHSDEY